MAKTTEPVTDQTRPFADVVRERANGKRHEELSEALQKLTAAVLDTGKKGTLKYTLIVEPMKGGVRNAVIVSDSIDVRPPEHDCEPSLFFADVNNNLVRNDPNAMQFESLREVPRDTPAMDLPDFDPATGELRDAQ